MTNETFNANELSPQELVVLYKKLKDQVKEAETKLNAIKPVLLEHYEKNAEIETDDAIYKVSCRSKDSFRFAEDVKPERIIWVLEENPEAAIERAMATQNIWSWLASKLEIMMKPEEITTINTKYHVVTKKDK